MSRYSGRLQGPHLEPSNVQIEIEDGRFRISAGRRQLGSWPMEKIEAERTSIYRFSLLIDSDSLEFFPDDPTKFSEEIGAVIDLTESRSRFGLRERMDRAGLG